MALTKEDIKITGEPNLDPRYCKFTVNQPVLPGGTYFCTSREMAEGSPLLEGLMDIPGIEQVSVSNSSFTFMKGGEEPWPVLGRQIGEVIRKQMVSEDPLFSQDIRDKFALDKTPGAPVAPAGPGGPTPEEANLDSEEAKAIIRLLNEEINPQVAMHGGHISLVAIDGDSAIIRMGGGCQGCGMANATLKQGVEVAILKQVPSIKRVLDVTDHASGSNPYYAPSRK